MNRKTFLPLAPLLVLAACSGGLSGLSSLPASSAGNYHLSAGDKVRLTVLGFDNITNQYTVDDAGMLSLPMLNAVSVEGKSTAQVEALIAGMLEQRSLARNANVSVQMVEYRPFYILGEVQKPGQYAYVPGMTVLTAVSIAGGYTFRAKRNLVAISRSDDGRVVKWRAAQTDRILPGDIVEVVEGTL